MAFGAASPSPLPAQAWRQLSRAMIGPLLRPGHEHFETLQRPATNRYPALHPQAIARCATPDDVAHAINFARRFGLESAVRGAGHCFADHSSTTGLLIETGLTDTVAVHGDLATIGAGAPLAEIYRKLHQHQAAIPAGCGPTVGIAGLALGGGLGVLGRTYGLTCDRLTAAQIVLADGVVITCDDTSDPDLYWALRGAGAGNFGVVTALTFRTVADRQAVAFHLTWPDNDALATLIAWMEWAPKAPDAMAASLVVRAAADSSVPPQAHLIGAFLSDGPAAADALMHFERLAGAAVRNRKLAGAPISDVKAQLAEFGAEIGAGSSTAMDRSASEFHREQLPASSAAALHQALTIDRIPGQARELAFTPMGAAYNRVPADATASCTAATSSCWNTRPPRIRPNQLPPGPPRTNGWATSANCSMDTAPAARTRTSPTRSWPIRCARTTGKTCPGCAMSSVTTIPTTFSVTSSRSLWGPTRPIHEEMW